ncbi:hypothetical protein M3172_13370 [Mesobacillus subterraneus]|uniref:hypothetical protein n=1 Tax=Mesobacillus subterraneus TaxID=285983 RepID=UPI00203CAFC4|nr:hypothetical protein [Mesobacillus subterraneus]MCM3574180.1 hypothetical protein [Mesobacillus subterraneus]
MHSLKISKITIPYDSQLLLQWKRRNPAVVPAFLLGRKGAGISNGYGFGEWHAEQYFRSHGYHVFTDEFNFLSQKSMFDPYNRMIATLIDQERIAAFKQEVARLIEGNVSIENPDLFVYNLDSIFFVEVKKGRDHLRESQLRFMYLAKEYLGIESVLVYLSDKILEVEVEEIEEQFSMTELQEA